MGKTYTLLIKVMLSLCIIMTGSNAWGQSDYSTDYTGNITLTNSNCKVIINDTEYPGLKAGSSSNAGSMTLTVPSGTKYLHLHVAAWNGETVKLTVTPKGYSNDISLTTNSGISGNSPFTFSGNPSSSDYYKVITFTNALTSNTVFTFKATSGKRFVVWGVTAEEESSGPSIPTFDPDGGTVVSGTTVTVSTTTSGATIYYTTDGSEPTTTSTAYTEPIAINASCTLKAIAVKDGESSDVAEAAYIVAEQVVAPTFTPAAGTYSSVQNVTISCETAGATIYYTTDGTAPTTESTAYSGAISIDETTTIKAIAVKDGMITSEVAVATFTMHIPSITVNTNSINATQAESDGTITVTYNNITTIAAEVKFYESDGTTPATYNWIDAEINNTNNVDYVISANTGNERTAYMKVYALDDEANDVYSELITITQEEYVAPTIACVTLSNSNIVSAAAAADSYSTYEIEDINNKQWNAYAIKKAHSNATSAYHYLQIKKSDNSTSYYLQVPEYGTKITKLTMTVSSSSKPMTDGGNQQTLFFSSSNSTSAAGDGVASGTGSSTVNIDCSSLDLNTGYITSGGAVRIWDVTVEYENTLKLNGSGYATYASTSALDFTNVTGYTAWQITGVSDTSINFEQITGTVKPGTGVFLKGTAGEEITIKHVGAGVELISNKLEGVTAASGKTINADEYYGLSGAKFVKVNAGTVPAGKAILPASVVNGSEVKSLSFNFDDDIATGIGNVEAGSVINDGNVYDLSGRIVKNPTRGLYIMNGKKVFVK